MPQIIAPPENKIPEKRPIITTCPHCQYTISYTEDEVERVDNEGMGVICPQCGAVIETGRIVPFTFPDSFHHCSVDNEATALTNRQTQDYIDEVKRELKQELNIGEFTFAGSGDTMVFGFKMEDEDLIFVAKNYWEDSVVKE